MNIELSDVESVNKIRDTGKSQWWCEVCDSVRRRHVWMISLYSSEHSFWLCDKHMPDSIRALWALRGCE